MVGSNAYVLSDVGVEASFVNGLYHALSSVSTQLEPWAIPPVTTRLLFFAGPVVMRIVWPTRFVGLLGPRPMPATPMPAGVVDPLPVIVTW